MGRQDNSLMENKSRREDNPISLSPMSFVRRAARLPIRELIGRIGRLLFCLPKNIITIGLLSRRLKKQNKKLVFILLTGRMGDLIAAEPVIRHVKQPGDYIVWPCRARYAEVLRFNPFIDEILIASSDFEASLLKRVFPRHRWINLLRDRSLCNVFGVKLHNPNLPGINVDNQFTFGANTDIFALLGTNKILNERPRIYVDPTFDAESFIAGIFPNGAPFLVLHPLSDEISRSWSVDKVKEFADWVLEKTSFNLIEVGMPPVLVPGEKIFTMTNHLTLSQQMAVISHAALFVGVDSGFSHIANALGIQSVLLLGEYLGFKTHLPLLVHDRDVVVRGAGQSHEIDVADIYAAVSLLLPKN